METKRKYEVCLMVCQVAYLRAIERFAIGLKPCKFAAKMKALYPFKPIKSIKIGIVSFFRVNYYYKII